MDKKYHLADQPIPAGFRIFEERVDVMGVVRNKKVVLPFCRAKKQTIKLELDPTNSNDPNAIKVIGEWPGLFWSKRAQLGFVPRAVAKQLASADVAHLVTARLLKTYAGSDGFVEVLFQIIGPATHYSPYATASSSPLVAARAKIAAGNSDDAEVDLLAIVEAEEQQSRNSGLGVAPRAYLDLAKLYRKGKRGDDEVAILERYERQIKAPGVVPGQLADRLAKLRKG